MLQVSSVQTLASGDAVITCTPLSPVRALSIAVAVQFPSADGPTCIKIVYNGCPAEGLLICTSAL